MWEQYSISYSRGLSYYTYLAMRDSVYRIHELFNKKIEMYDSLYMIKIISYRELQNYYKIG